MGKVNAAWSVLNDPVQRQAYDTWLSGSAQGTFRGTDQTPPRRPTRVYAAGTGPDSTSFEPEPHYHVATPGCALLAPLPLLLVFGLLAAIYVFTAYAASSDSPTDAPPVLSGRTDAAAYRLGTCIEFYETSAVAAQPVAVPCDGGHDAIVRRVGAAAVSCAAGETSALIPNTDLPLCLVAFSG